MSKFKYTG